LIDVLTDVVGIVESTLIFTKGYWIPAWIQ
jgi:hypothetical protein